MLQRLGLVIKCLIVLYLTIKVSSDAVVIQKGQTLRIIDVFVIGPAMILAGASIAKKAKSRNDDFFSLGLYAIGVGTIIFNGKNYLLQRDELEKSANLAGSHFNT